MPDKSFQAKLVNLLRLMRPEQWIKNTFVFLPLFCGGQLFNTSLLIDALIAFCSFVAASSAIYCFNDVVDAPLDRLHQRKKHRPVASGDVSQKAAIALGCISAAISIAICLLSFKDAGTLYSVLSYIILNIAYVFWLKNVAIVDVFIIACGFVLRVAGGGFATGIVLSPWIVMMTFLLTLFLAFAKRRNDVAACSKTGNCLRASVSNYNLSFINQVLGVLASITIVCYLMFTVSEEVIQRTGCPYLIYTSVFVIFGMLRYLQLAIVFSNTGRPSRVLLTDPFIILSVTAWIISFFVILYC